MSFLCVAAIHCFYLILIHKQSPNYNFNCYYCEDRLPIHTYTCIWHFTAQRCLLSRMVTMQRQHSHFGIYYLGSVKQSHDEMFVWKKEEEEGKKWNENKNKTKTISFPNPADVFKLSVFAFQNVMNFDTLCALLDRDMRPPSHTSSKNNNNKSNNNDRLRANKSKSKTDGRKGKGEREQAFFWVNFDKYTAERWNPN